MENALRNDGVGGSNPSCGTDVLPQAIMHLSTTILAAIAMLGLTTVPALAQQRELSPAETVAVRFPREWNPAVEMPLLAKHGRHFEQRPAPPFNSYSPPALPGLPHPVTDVAKETRPYADPFANRNAFFNEMQIVSIKDRLKLTPEQARYWPPVESALRAIVLRKTRDGVTAPDPDSVERLNAAARELVKHLSEAQKREVQTLAHLVGLRNQL
jgi:hypothetical protein